MIIHNMLRLTIFLAMVLAASAASLSKKDLLERLLRVLTENDREVEKREMYTFGYDAEKQRLLLEMRICVVGNEGLDCEGRAGHEVLVFHNDTGTLITAKFLKYRDNGRAPYIKLYLEDIVDGDVYFVTACEVTDKGTFEKCNGHTFTGGQSVTYPNTSFIKAKKISEDFLPMMKIKKPGNGIDVRKKPNPVG